MNVAMYLYSSQFFWSTVFISNHIFSNLFLTKEMFSTLTWVFRIFDYHYMYWIELLFHSYSHHTRTNRTFIKSVLIFLYEGINKWFKEYYYYHFYYLMNNESWSNEIYMCSINYIFSSWNYLNRCLVLFFCQQIAYKTINCI